MIILVMCALPYVVAYVVKQKKQQSEEDQTKPGAITEEMVDWAISQLSGDNPGIEGWESMRKERLHINHRAGTFKCAMRIERAELPVNGQETSVGVKFNLHARVRDGQVEGVQLRNIRAKQVRGRRPPLLTSVFGSKYSILADHQQREVTAAVRSITQGFCPTNDCSQSAH